MTAAKRKDNVGGSSVQPPPVQPGPQPAPTPKVEENVAQAASKQDQTLETLKAAWTKRGVDLSKMQVKMDGKFMLINVDANWPTIKLGPGGGGELPALRSYPKFFDAAIIADQLLAKQTERDQKKAAAAQPKPAVEVQKPKEVSKETVTAKKAKADAELERQLQQA